MVTYRNTARGWISTEYLRAVHSSVERVHFVCQWMVVGAETLLSDGLIGCCVFRPDAMDGA